MDKVEKPGLYKVAESRLYEKVYGFENLFLAWEKVEENHGCAGVDGVTVENFALRAGENIESLQRDLIRKIYQPSQLLRIDVAKAIGGSRRLLVPTVKDRLVQEAVLSIINPLLEPEFENCSFAYRKGRSVKQAVFQIKEYHDRGYCWVVNADIDNFFDEVDHRLLLSRLKEIVPDEGIISLIHAWIKAEVYDHGSIKPLEKGLPQGSPISPALSNLYLDKFDEALLQKKRHMIRFADDYLILCKDRPDAEDALELSKDILETLLLHLDEKKTSIDHFDQGFEYLGNLFLRSMIMPQSKKGSKEREPRGEASDSLPFYHHTAENAQPDQVTMTLQKAIIPRQTPADASTTTTTTTTSPSPSSSSATTTSSSSSSSSSLSQVNQAYKPRVELRPFMRTLYLQEQGCVIGRSDERLLISKEDQVLAEIPAIKVDQIIMFGNSHLTTPALKFCLTEGIPIFILSQYGKYYGVVDPFQYKNMELQKIQFIKSMEDEFCRKTSIFILQGKIHNSRILLQRYNRRREDLDLTASVEALNQLLSDISKANTLEQVRGYEGAAAHVYYQAYGHLFSDDFQFTKRVRRPPTDPINSLLSFGYTLLFYNVYSMACAHGLNPYPGFLHPLRQDHPALISDMIEEFRSPVVDSLCLYLLNGKILKQEDFYWKKEEPSACYLTPLARKTFIKSFESKISTQIQHPHTGFKVDYRRCISLQVQEMIRYLKGDIEEYRPMVVR